MKTLQVELPDDLARAVEQAVQAGQFENVQEVLRTAVRDFVGRHRYALIEEQQLRDIAWALQEKTHPV